MLKTGKLSDSFRCQAEFMIGFGSASSLPVKINQPTDSVSYAAYLKHKFLSCVRLDISITMDR